VQHRPVPDRSHPDSSAFSSDISRARPQTNRTERWNRIAALTRSQSGVAARWQLRAFGWTDKQIDHELAFARWQSPAPGLVVVHTGPLLEEARLWVGVLHAGRGAVLSHLTAARRSGLHWVGRDLIDVLTPKGDLVEPLEGYFFHQTRRPYERWVKPVSGPPRLPLEHAALLAAEREPVVRRGIGLLAACVQQGLSTADRFGSAIPHIRKLRNGKTFKLVLGDIAGGAQSFAEINVGKLCRDAGLMPPTRQVVRLDKQGRRRYLDCVWELADGRVIVLEIDGSFHAEVTAWWKDMKRERSVVVQGDTVLRCSTIELRLEANDIIDDLKRVGVPSRHRFVQAS
jgi:hypothetical protein